MDAFLRHLEVDDLALADLVGLAFADSQDDQGAVIAHLGDGDGDLAAAHFEGDDDIAVFSPEHGVLRGLSLGAGLAIRGCWQS